MPGKCCVLGCNSGYDTVKEKINIFSFPKDEILKQKWLKAIGRKDFKPGKWAKVCHKHFKESDIIRHCMGINRKTGKQTLLPAKVKLNDGAVPSIDLNNPYQSRSENEDESQTLTSRRSSPRKRHLARNSSSISEQGNLSDDDIPLDKLKNQDSSSDTIKSMDKNLTQDTNTEILEGNDKSVRKKFKKLLEDYEQLKETSVGLDQEIKVLEKVNIELKCKIFK